MTNLYLATYSHDWNEGHTSFSDLDALDEFLRQEFTLPKDIKSWTKTYWEMIEESYEEENWKSFQILTIDTHTHKVSTFVRPEPQDSAPEHNTFMQQVITRSAPRWAWDFIDDHLGLDGLNEPTARSAMLAMQVACEVVSDLLTRADLMVLEEWQDLATDTSGNPIVWLNHYKDERGRTWTMEWSCQCDDFDYSPTSSDWIGPDDETHKHLWEMFPEKE